MISHFFLYLSRTVLFSPHFSPCFIERQSYFLVISLIHSLKYTWCYLSPKLTLYLNGASSQSCPPHSLRVTSVIILSFFPNFLSCPFIFFFLFIYCSSSTWIFLKEHLFLLQHAAPSLWHLCESLLSFITPVITVLITERQSGSIPWRCQWQQVEGSQGYLFQWLRRVSDGSASLASVCIL